MNKQTNETTTLCFVFVVIYYIYIFPLFCSYSQTCLQRPPKGNTKSGLWRQVSIVHVSMRNLFSKGNKKCGLCIQVVTRAGLTVFTMVCMNKDWWAIQTILFPTQLTYTFLAWPWRFSISQPGWWRSSPLSWSSRPGDRSRQRREYRWQVRRSSSWVYWCSWLRTQRRTVPSYRWLLVPTGMQ